MKISTFMFTILIAFSAIKLSDAFTSCANCSGACEPNPEYPANGGFIPQDDCHECTQWAPDFTAWQTPNECKVVDNGGACRCAPPPPPSASPSAAPSVFPSASPSATPTDSPTLVMQTCDYNTEVFDGTACQTSDNLMSNQDCAVLKSIYLRAKCCPDNAASFADPPANTATGSLDVNAQGCVSYDDKVFNGQQCVDVVDHLLYAGCPDLKTWYEGGPPAFTYNVGQQCVGGSEKQLGVCGWGGIYCTDDADCATQTTTSCYDGSSVKVSWQVCQSECTSPTHGACTAVRAYFNPTEFTSVSNDPSNAEDEGLCYLQYGEDVTLNAGIRQMCARTDAACTGSASGDCST